MTTTANPTTTTSTASTTSIDAVEALRLLRSSRASRVGFSVDGEPFVVPADLEVEAGGRIVLRPDDDHACGHLDGRPVAVEVDGHEPIPGSGWYVVVHGTASVVDDATDQSTRHRPALDEWASRRPDRRFCVVPGSITGHHVAHAVVDTWFAGVPAS